MDSGVDILHYVKHYEEEGKEKNCSKVSKIATMFQFSEDGEDRDGGPGHHVTVVRTESHVARFNTARALFEKMSEKNGGTLEAPHQRPSRVRLHHHSGGTPVGRGAPSPTCGMALSRSPSPASIKPIAYSNGHHHHHHSHSHRHHPSVHPHNKVTSSGCSSSSSIATITSTSSTSCVTSTFFTCIQNPSTSPSILSLSPKKSADAHDCPKVSHHKRTSSLTANCTSSASSATSLHSTSSKSGVGTPEMTSTKTEMWAGGQQKKTREDDVSRSEIRLKPDFDKHSHQHSQQSQHSQHHLNNGICETFEKTTTTPKSDHHHHHHHKNKPETFGKPVKPSKPETLIDKPLSSHLQNQQLIQRHKNWFQNYSKAKSPMSSSRSGQPLSPTSSNTVSPEPRSPILLDKSKSFDDLLHKGTKSDDELSPTSKIAKPFVKEVHLQKKAAEDTPQRHSDWRRERAAILSGRSVRPGDEGTKPSIEPTAVKSFEEVPTLPSCWSPPKQYNQLPVPTHEKISSSKTSPSPSASVRQVPSRKDDLPDVQRESNKALQEPAAEIHGVSHRRGGSSTTTTAGVIRRRSMDSAGPTCRRDSASSRPADEAEVIWRLREDVCGGDRDKRLKEWEKRKTQKKENEVLPIDEGSRRASLPASDISRRSWNEHRERKRVDGREHDKLAKKENEEETESKKKSEEIERRKKELGEERIKKENDYMRDDPERIRRIEYERRINEREEREAKKTEEIEKRRRKEEMQYKEERGDEKKLKEREESERRMVELERKKKNEENDMKRREEDAERQRKEELEKRKRLLEKKKEDMETKRREEEAMIKEELDRKRKEKEELEKKKRAEDERELKRKYVEELERKKKEELERRRKEEEEFQRRRREKEELERERREEEQLKMKRKEEEEAMEKRKKEKEELERRRKEEDEVEKKKKEELEKRRREELEKRRKEEEELERMKREEEELERIKREEEIERRRIEDMERKKRKEEELEKKRTEEIEKRKKELERKKKEEELERKRKEEELERKRKEELERKRKEEELERKRIEEELERKRKDEELERKRKEEELERKRKEEELERKRKEEELERKRKEELERKKKEEEQERKKKEEELERKRKEEEQERKRNEELERKKKEEELEIKKKEEEQERKRKEEELERKRKEEELERKRKEELERKKKEELEILEQKRKEEDLERKKKEEEEQENKRREELTRQRKKEEEESRKQEKENTKIDTEEEVKKKIRITEERIEEELKHDETNVEIERKIVEQEDVKKRLEEAKITAEDDWKRRIIVEKEEGRWSKGEEEMVTNEYDEHEMKRQQEQHRRKREEERVKEELERKWQAKREQMEEEERIRREKDRLQIEKTKRRIAELKKERDEMQRQQAVRLRRLMREENGEEPEDEEEELEQEEEDPREELSLQEQRPFPESGETVSTVVSSPILLKSLTDHDTREDKQISEEKSPSPILTSKTTWNAEGSRDVIAKVEEKLIQSSPEEVETRTMNQISPEPPRAEAQREGGITPTKLLAGEEDAEGRKSVGEEKRLKGEEVFYDHTVISAQHKIQFCTGPYHASSTNDEPSEKSDQPSSNEQQEIISSTLSSNFEPLPPPIPPHNVDPASLASQKDNVDNRLPPLPLGERGSAPTNALPPEPEFMTPEEEEKLLSHKILTDAEAREVSAILKEEATRPEEGGEAKVPEEDPEGLDKDYDSVCVDSPTPENEEDPGFFAHEITEEGFVVRAKEVLIEDGVHYFEDGHFWIQVPGLNDEDEDDLPESVPVHAHTKLKFSKDPIKLFSTFSINDYDRKNEDVDPVAASAEYELEKRVEKMDVFPVQIDKGEGGLGLSIIGMGVGADAGVEKLGIFVKTINPAGATDRDGRIRVNDQIIEVDNQSLVGVTQMFAASVLKNTNGTVNFLIGRETDPDNSEVAMLIKQSLLADQERDERRRALEGPNYDPRNSGIFESFSSQSGGESPSDEGPRNHFSHYADEGNPYREEFGDTYGSCPPSPIEGVSSTQDPFNRDVSAKELMQTTDIMILSQHLEEAQQRSLLYEEEINTLRSKINHLEKEMGEKADLVSSLNETTLKLKDVEDKLQSRQVEIATYQDMLEQSQGQYIILEKKYYKAKKIIKEYQSRERDFLHREEYHITQLEEKDALYNSLVKALKDRVIQLEGDLIKAQQQAGLPVKVPPDLNAQSSNLIQSNAQDNHSSPAQKEPPRKPSAVSSLDADLSDTEGADPHTSEGSKSSTVERKVPSKEELDVAVPPTELLDNSFSKAKGELASRGGLANRQLPSLKKTSSTTSANSFEDLDENIEESLIETQQQLHSPQHNSPTSAQPQEEVFHQHPTSPTSPPSSTIVSSTTATTHSPSNSMVANSPGFGGRLPPPYPTSTHAQASSTSSSPHHQPPPYQPPPSAPLSHRQVISPETHGGRGPDGPTHRHAPPIARVQPVNRVEASPAPQIHPQHHHQPQLAQQGTPQQQQQQQQQQQTPQQVHQQTLAHQLKALLAEREGNSDHMVRGNREGNPMKKSPSSLMEDVRQAVIQADMSIGKKPLISGPIHVSSTAQVVSTGQFVHNRTSPQKNQAVATTLQQRISRDSGSWGSKLSSEVAPSNPHGGVVLLSQRPIDSTLPSSTQGDENEGMRARNILLCSGDSNSSSSFDSQPPAEKVKAPRDAISVFDWTKEQVAQWLVVQGLESYVSTFVSAGITGPRLINIDTKDLKSLGLSSDDKSKIKRKVKELRQNLEKERKQIEKENKEREKLQKKAEKLAEKAERKKK